MSTKSTRRTPENAHEDRRSRGHLPSVNLCFSFVLLPLCLVGFAFGTQIMFSGNIRLSVLAICSCSVVQFFCREDWFSHLERHHCHQDLSIFQFYHALAPDDRNPCSASLRRLSGTIWAWMAQCQIYLLEIFTLASHVRTLTPFSDLQPSI